MTSCTTVKEIPVYEVVEVIRDRPVKVSDELVQPVKINPLPPRDAYEAMTNGERSIVLLGAVGEYNEALGMCNAQLQEISTLND